MNETRKKYNSERICKYILECLNNRQSSLFPQFEYLK